MPRNGRLIVALAGGPGSGKTTVAGALAEKLGGSAVGFGDYVRHLAAVDGAAMDRGSLQRIGQRAVEDSPSEFTLRFIEWACLDTDKPVVIEGMRHLSVNDAIKSWAQELGARYVLILLDAPVEGRAMRRCDGDTVALRRIEHHPVERETAETLPSRADFIVDVSKSIDLVVAEIGAALAPDLNGGSIRT